MPLALHRFYRPFDVFHGVVDVRAEPQASGGRAGDAVIVIHGIQDFVPVAGGHFDDTYTTTQLLFFRCDQLSAGSLQTCLQSSGKFQRSASTLAGWTML